jgi:hypothetical protein
VHLVHTFSIDTYLPWANQISLQALHPGCGVCPSLTALTELSIIYSRGGPLEAGRRGRAISAPCPHLQHWYLPALDQPNLTASPAPRVWGVPEPNRTCGVIYHI